MTTVDQPIITDDWIAWRARVDEKLKHVALKEDLERVKIWVILTQISVGALVVAAIKILP